MSYLRLCLVVALSFPASSLQQAKNPLNDFCRRWGHQTAQVDGKLFIDGGLVAWNPLSSNPLNYTNTWLLYSDLNTSVQDGGMPMQHANLTKNSTVPSVSGGTLWADEVNKCFYLYGGEYQNTPSDFSFWTYDTILNQWNETTYTSNAKPIQRVSFGAGTQIEELGMGYYYGGWMNNRTSPSYNGNPVTTSNLIVWDFTRGTLNNNTGPDGVGRAEGSLQYLPASDSGLLVYFGGVEDPYKNGSFVGANMSTIHIFDVASSKWYMQTARGTVPAARRQFCAGVTWADDHSSYNIYLYGGYNVDPDNVTAFDDAYILSLPSFTWIKVFPTDNSTNNANGHGGCSGNVLRRDQMLIIGGWFPSTDRCDTQNSYGQHNMNLGYNGAANSLWDKYDTTLSTYFVPTPVISVIGGGPTGGATATKPSNWDNPDLAVYFARPPPSFTARAATRTVSTGTASPTSTGKSSKTNVGAIAGGVVGGLVGLIAILSLLLFCLHRRKKAMKNREVEKSSSSNVPVELPAAPSVHEMPSPGAAKYMAMQQPPDGVHPAFSGTASMHSRSPSDHHPQSSPYQEQAYLGSSPGSAAAYPSYHSAEYPNQHSPYQQNHAPYPPYSDNPNAYDSQPHPNAYDPHGYSLPGSPTHTRTWSYPTPISPSYPPPALVQAQVYYPPPPEPSTTSHPSSSDRTGTTPVGTTPEGTTYSGSTETQAPPSTMNTPAQFYARPVSRSPRVMQQGLSPGQYGGEGGDDGSLRGSIDSRRRPIKGRFVEVDHM